MDKPDLHDLKQFVVEHSFPTDILIETVSRCNLRCIMCPQDQLTRSSGVMSFDLWKKIVDEVAERSPKTRLWPALMGEPLMTKTDIFDMVRYAKDAGVGEIHLNSNLNLFRRNWLDALFESGLDHMIVGIDAATPETYAKIRRRGDYDTVTEAIRMIVTERERRGLTWPKITLQYIVMDENEGEEQAFVDYWRDLGLPVKLKLKPRTGWADAVGTWQGLDTTAKSADRMPCTWLLRQMTVFHDGRVPQCDGDWDGHFICGDVTRQSLDAIWNGRLKASRRAHMKGRYDFRPCRDCNDWAAGRSTWVDCGQTTSP